MTTVLAFLLTLGVLIVVHEWGHYRAAVACGVKVLRFSVGFGRPLLRWQRGETEFVISALPLGGYVKMLDERELGPGEALPAEDAARAFNRQSLRARAFIVFAGPLANLVLAALLYAATFWIGIEEPKSLLGAPVAGSMADAAGQRAGDWVRELAQTGDAGDGLTTPDWEPIESYSELRWALTDAALGERNLLLRVSDVNGAHQRELMLPLGTLGVREVDAQLLRRIGLGAPFAEPVIGRVIENGPASRAGLKEGDRVISVDGQAVDDASRLRERIRAAVDAEGQAQPLGFLVERSQAPGAATERVEIEVLPGVQGERGQYLARIEAYIGQPAASVLVRHGPVKGLWLGVQRTWDVSVLSLRMLGKMLIGEASLKNLSGPLTIAEVAGQSAQLGLVYYLGFLALVSVSLGVLNLLPLPMLDGGHLMYYLFEAVTGRPVSEVWLERLQRGGLAIVVLMMSLALYNDLARLFGLY
ncbi:RIP metalloprotease RseP [Rivibacter subsaxonicus]|uniref:Zinc metalloprotease n=1 Tax=Rivibacter subsaxonicus TaxID=457575 RepID=A0A4Q7VCR2_9BURK|nr:RIP metalloprotease RseP [Rivibacter subsaxonicus]RZT92538.1 site-2 protease [Rivibacter subsaxonicus]